MGWNRDKLNIALMLHFVPIIAVFQYSNYEKSKLSSAPFRVRWEANQQIYTGSNIDASNQPFLSINLWELKFEMCNLGNS